MVTHYVEDYDGKRNADAVDPAPAETPASPVEEAPSKAAPTAKVVTAETDAKQSTKKTATAKTKG